MPTVNKTITKKRDNSTIWGEMGHDEYFLVPKPGVKIISALLQGGSTKDPSNNNVTTASARYKLGPKPNQIRVDWWRNGSTHLNYSLEITYEVNSTDAIQVKSNNSLTPLLRRTHGIETISFEKSNDVYYPIHFDVEAPSTAVIENLMILIGNPLTVEEFDVNVGTIFAHVKANEVTITGVGQKVFSPWQLTATVGDPPKIFTALVEWSAPEEVGCIYQITLKQQLWHREGARGWA